MFECMYLCVCICVRGRDTHTAPKASGISNCPRLSVCPLDPRTSNVRRTAPALSGHRGRRLRNIILCDPHNGTQQIIRVKDVILALRQPPPRHERAARTRQTRKIAREIPPRGRETGCAGVTVTEAQVSVMFALSRKRNVGNERRGVGEKVICQIVALAVAPEHGRQDRFVLACITVEHTQ